MLRESGGDIFTIVVGKQNEKIFMAKMNKDEYTYVWEYDNVDVVGEQLINLIRQLEAYSTNSVYVQSGSDWEITDIRLEKNQKIAVISVERLYENGGTSENIVEIYYLNDGLLDKSAWNDQELFSYDYVSRGPIDGDFILTYYNETAAEFSNSN